MAEPTAANPAEAVAHHTHLIARIGRFNIAIPINVVISVHEAPLVFPVPCAQPGIAGAIKFAGIALPVFDLRRSLRLEPRPVAPSDRLVLIDAGARLMALVVDDVLEFARIERLSDESTQSLFGNTPVNTRIIAGIACAPQLCAVLDPEGILAPDLWDVANAGSAYEESEDRSHPLWARTAALAELPKAPAAAGLEAAVLQISGQRFAVELSCVVEFFQLTAHVPVPARSPFAVSLLNRRGEALVLFDPRPILGLSGAPLPARVDGIVLSSDRMTMALPVDQLEGLEVLAYQDSGIRPGRFCRSVHPSPAGAILLLDVPMLLHHAYSAFGGRPDAAGAVA